MILSDYTIFQMSEFSETEYEKNISINGQLIKFKNPLINPFVEKTTRFKGMSYGLSCSGYDLRLGEKIKIVCDDPNQILNPEYDQSGIYKEYKISEYGWIIKPGQFILAHTEEYVTMPENIVGMIKDKSSWVRYGLTVQNTIIEPGWEGQITLELINHNSVPILLHKGVGIVQIVFQLLDRTPHIPYNKRNNGQGGKYQGQTGVNPSRI